MRTRHRFDEMAATDRQSVPQQADVTNSADQAQQADPHAQIMELQRLAGNRAVSRLLGSPGNSLDPATRTQMESRFDADFAGVRLHTGPAATASAQALNANAYTVGEDIVLHQDAFRPGTVAGQRLLAHELAHVVQQSAPGASATPARAEQEAQRAGSTLGIGSLVSASVPAGTVQMDGPRGEVSSSSSSRDGEPIRTRVRTRFVIPLLPDLSLGWMSMLDDVSVQMGVQGADLRTLEPGDPLYTEQYQIAMTLMRMKWEHDLGRGHSLRGGLDLSTRLSLDVAGGALTLNPSTRLKADLLQYRSPRSRAGQFSLGLGAEGALGARGTPGGSFERRGSVGLSAGAGYSLQLEDNLSMFLRVNGQFEWNERNFEELDGTPRFTGTVSIGVNF
jgi:hypothetical protein